MSFSTRLTVAMVMLVLDRSSSMNYAFQGSTACAILKPDAIQFLSNFAPGRDMVGLVVFGSTSYLAPARTNFDQPDAMTSCPVRPTSTHALQALSLMNSDFMHRQSEAFAKRLAAECGADRR